MEITELKVGDVVEIEIEGREKRLATLIGSIDGGTRKFALDTPYYNTETEAKSNLHQLSGLEDKAREFGFDPSQPIGWYYSARQTKILRLMEHCPQCHRVDCGGRRAQVS
jgi:hypothetical protein